MTSDHDSVIVRSVLSSICAFTVERTRPGASRRRETSKSGSRFRFSTGVSLTVTSGDAPTRPAADAGGGQKKGNGMILPSPHEVGFRDAYDRSASILGPNRTESFEAALEVQRLRFAWMPQDVRVILLAESHLWTRHEDNLSRVQFKTRRKRTTEPRGNRLRACHLLPGSWRIILGDAKGLTKPRDAAILDVISRHRARSPFSALRSQER